MVGIVVDILRRVIGGYNGGTFIVRTRLGGGFNGNGKIRGVELTQTTLLVFVDLYNGLVYFFCGVKVMVPILQGLFGGNFGTVIGFDYRRRFFLSTP